MSDDDRAVVEMTVNGVKYKALVEPRYLLVDFLRHEIGLKGAHLGCGHGVCGACTVLIDGRTARSCLQFAVDAAGANVTTVEGLAADDVLDLVQAAFRDNHALQCGFCTPGFLMTVHELLAHNPDPDEAEIREALTNNLCRCTGYVNIVRAVQDAARRMRAAKSVSERAQ